MSGRSLQVSLAMLVLVAGCSPLPAGPTPTGSLVQTAARPHAQAAWSVVPLPTVPAVVQAALERDKDAVLREIRQAEHFKAVTVSPAATVRQWRVGNAVVGYVATLHGQVAFDRPGWHKAGGFVVDFCLDPAGADLGGTYAFTVRSEHPVSGWRSPRRSLDDAGPLTLAREAKPPVIREAGERLAAAQRARLVEGLPGLRLSATKVFASALAVRYHGALVGYVETQTASALPQGDVVGVQVLNCLDPAGGLIFAEARAASANHLDRYRRLPL